MDRSFRETALAEIDSEAQAATQLRGLQREYSLEDICIMTRSAPANLLGLSDMGTLSAGATADVVVYRDDPNRETMFSSPVKLFRHGKAVDLHNQPLHQSPSAIKRTHTVRPAFNQSSLSALADLHQRHSSFRMERMWISDDELQSHVGSVPVVHPCRTRQDAVNEAGGKR